MSDSFEDSLIPVTIVTGFLGAGKTTLLNRILHEDHKHRIAVIENEYGEAGIDDELLVHSEAEQIVSMSNGCICCTIRGDLSRILTDLRRMREKGESKFDWVVIETTGMADPGPVAQTFFLDDVVAAFFRLDGVITVVDALNGGATLDRQPEAQAQVGFADRILLSKVDLTDAETAAALKERLRAMNPHAEIREVNMGECPVDVVLDIKGFNISDVLNVSPDFLTGSHRHHHSDEIASFLYESDRPFDPQRFEHYFMSLVNVYGTDLLRYKGILYLKGADRKLVLQGVHMLAGTQPFGPWEGAPKTQLVFIGRNLPKEALIKGLDACLC